MTIVSYERAFDEAAAELDVLLQEATAINDRVSELRDTLWVLSRNLKGGGKRKEKLMKMLGEVSIVDPSLTDAVKDALYADPKSRKVPAIQVQDVMEIRGYDFANFGNPLASVHSTLRRLAAQGEIGSAIQNGQTVYWWNKTRYGARNSLANMLAAEELRKKVDRKIRARVDQQLRKSGIYVR